MKNNGSPGIYIGKSRIEQLNSGKPLTANPLKKYQKHPECIKKEEI
jgi:hypothetical protein